MDSDLDDIWYYVAVHSGSIDVADRLIDAIAERLLSHRQPSTLGTGGMRTCGQGCAAFPSVDS
jgi:hypothetical protein